jgi:hypothetical protein
MEHEPAEPRVPDLAALDRLRTVLLLAIAACGLLIAALSFAPWVAFESTIGGPDAVSFDLSGTETSRLRDVETLERNTIQPEDGWCSCRVEIGDGYLTAAMGVLLVAAAGLALATGRDQLATAPGVVLAMIAFAGAGFNAAGEWHALIWTSESFTEEVGGSATVWLWLLAAVAAAGALAAGALWTLERATAIAEDEYDVEDGDEEPFEERLNSWA